MEKQMNLKMILLTFLFLSTQLYAERITITKDNIKETNFSLKRIQSYSGIVIYEVPATMKNHNLVGVNVTVDLKSKNPREAKMDFGPSIINTPNNDVNRKRIAFYMDQTFRKKCTCTISFMYSSSIVYDVKLDSITPIQ